MWEGDKHIYNKGLWETEMKFQDVLNHPFATYVQAKDQILGRVQLSEI